MTRRDILRLLGVSGIGSLLPGVREVSAQTSAAYAVNGSGPTLITFDDSVGRDAALTDKYRVILMDYPPASVQKSESRSVIDSFTPDRVCSDILAVADANRVGRFAYYGYSWGGVVGLQLASRTDRLTALICGGWPPLGAPYAGMANIQGSQAIYNTFYQHLVDWPEREAVAAIACPRLAVAGRDDVIVTPDVTARIGPLVAEHREELERMGWTVQLVDGFTHNLGVRPDVLVPLVRGFLDPLLLRE